MNKIFKSASLIFDCLLLFFIFFFSGCASYKAQPLEDFTNKDSVAIPTVVQSPELENVVIIP